MTTAFKEKSSRSVSPHKSSFSLTKLKSRKRRTSLTSKTLSFSERSLETTRKLTFSNLGTLATTYLLSLYFQSLQEASLTKLRASAS